MKKLNGYIGFYRGRRFEVHAENTYKAQCLIAEQNRIKKSHEITVILAEKDGKPVEHKADF
jgi:hypothetical protein